MFALRILIFLAAVSVCYLLYLHMGTVAPAPTTAGTERPVAEAPATHSQYKQAMDKAHAAAQQMQAQRVEADTQ